MDVCMYIHICTYVLGSAPTPSTTKDTDMERGGWGRWGGGQERTYSYRYTCRYVYIYAPPNKSPRWRTSSGIALGSVPAPPTTRDRFGVNPWSTQQVVIYAHILPLYVHAYMCMHRYIW